MRILMITDFYPPYLGGVEVVVRNLSRALVERGHDLGVVTIQPGGLPPYEEDDGVRVHRVRCSIHRAPRLLAQQRPWAPPVPDPEAARGIAAIVARERPDVVHGHDWLARSFLVSRRRSRARFVLSLHYYTATCAKKTLMLADEQCSGPGILKCLSCAGAHYGRAKGAGITLGNFAFAARERRTVDLFLPVSEATAAGNGLPGSGLPYEVIPNFVAASEPTSAAAAVAQDLPHEPFLLFVGDLRPEKGIDILLDAHRRLGSRIPLVLIGKRWPGSPSSLPPGVQLLEDQPNDAVREAQRRCLALIAPSVWPEPFGMVVAEALSAGRPVVATRTGGIPDLVDDGVNGLLVPPGDTTSLLDVLRRLIDDPALVRQLADGARLTADRFSAARVVPLVERAYRQVTIDR